MKSKSIKVSVSPLVGSNIEDVILEVMELLNKLELSSIAFYFNNIEVVVYNDSDIAATVNKYLMDLRTPKNKNQK
jgi:hypothetical protein